MSIKINREEVDRIPFNKETCGKGTWFEYGGVVYYTLKWHENNKTADVLIFEQGWNAPVLNIFNTDEDKDYIKLDAPDIILNF